MQIEYIIYTVPYYIQKNMPKYIVYSSKDQEPQYIYVKKFIAYMRKIGQINKSKLLRLFFIFTFFWQATIIY